MFLRTKTIVASFLIAIMVLGIFPLEAWITVTEAATQNNINSSVSSALHYLNSTQATDGHWGNSYPVAATANAVLAFENAGHYGWNSSDPYNTTVQKGLNWLFSKAITLPINARTSPGNPDTSGDGYGIYFVSNGANVQVYEDPMVLTAIVASQNPTQLTTTGPTNVSGRSYKAIVTDIVDYLSWAQDDEPTLSSPIYYGGWRYAPQSTTSDNSVSQWPIFGLLAAELWGIQAPSWVQNALLNWTTSDQNLKGNYSSNQYYGAFDYFPGDSIYSVAETAAGISELTYCGVQNNDSRILAAEGYLNRNWNPNGNPSGINWNIGDLYDMYSLMKACRSTLPTPIQFIYNYTGSSMIDWYSGVNEYADSLIANQSSTGSWIDWVQVTPSEIVETPLSTAWGALILEFIPVLVQYNLTVHVVDASTGTAVPGANIEVVGPENYTETSDIAGTVIFSGIQASSSYTVFASQAYYYPNSAPLSLTQNSDIIISLTQKQYNLKVHVVDAKTGGSVQNAIVEVVGPENYTETSDIAGTVIFSGIQASSSYTVFASQAYYYPNSAPLSLTQNSDIIISLTQKPSYGLNVNVVDSNGDPIENASVIVGSIRVYSNDSGLAYLNLLGGAYTVTASHADYVSASLSVDLNTARNVTLTLAYPFDYVGEIPDQNIITTQVESGYNVTLFNSLLSPMDVYLEWQYSGVIPPESWKSFNFSQLPTLIVEAADKGSSDYPKAWYKKPLAVTLTPTTGNDGAFLAEPIPYAAGSIFVYPDPPIEGQNTTIGVILHNPFNYTLSISRIDFQVSGLTIGGNFETIGNVSDVSLKVGEIRNFTISWIPDVSGHHCIKVVLIYSLDPQTASLSRNINIQGNVIPGIPYQYFFTLHNPYQTASQFNLQVSEVLPEGSIVQILLNGQPFDYVSDPFVTLAAGESDQVIVTVSIPSWGNWNQGKVDIKGLIDGNLVGGIEAILTPSFLGVNPLPGPSNSLQPYIEKVTMTGSDGLPLTTGANIAQPYNIQVIVNNPDDVSHDVNLQIIPNTENPGSVMQGAVDTASDPAWLSSAFSILGVPTEWDATPGSQIWSTPTIITIPKETQMTFVFKVVSYWQWIPKWDPKYLMASLVWAFATGLLTATDIAKIAPALGHLPDFQNLAAGFESADWFIPAEQFDFIILCNSEVQDFELRWLSTWVLYLLLHPQVLQPFLHSQRLPLVLESSLLARGRYYSRLFL